MRERLADLRIVDEHRLRRRLDALGRQRDPARRAQEWARIEADAATAAAVVAARRAAVPDLRYPEQLPVSARRDEIAAALRDHQVVVLAGETGSGKTTQLPKICLGLGRGVRGMVGHTQPRRIAARAVAERVAEECGVALGGPVGYQVRFTDRVDETTLVKVMTDGILLAEIERDRMLRRYDTIVVDEAHERSLNIDFLLGYLHRLLPRRPDLKLVITSATIDPQRFADHFGGAPVVEVSGRTYPVEIRHRPLVEPPAPDEDDDDEPAAPRDRTQAIIDALAELDREGPGDTLVFLAGEREIRDTADALEGLALPDTEIVPLYARLSAAEQHRVFAPHRGRRVVLATNVAETSLTVPGIRYVVDPGTARISRYSHRLKVQRLPIEPVSQASADQRAGRCGRVQDGVCIRLYDAADYAGRPRFTDPEILRTSLASVVLRMAALGLGDVADFPFLDPPDRRQVAAGVALLEELGALVPAAGTGPLRLTAVGRRLAALPVDPRLGRMLIAAGDEGCLTEVLAIVSGLSVQDPRERPVERREAADAMHRRFADATSDFLGYWNLWRYLREQQRALSGNAFRRRCRDEFLHYLRVREWQDLHGQLRAACRDVGLTANDVPASGDQVHRALLAGLLSHVGLRQPERGDYLGARGARFALWPGSSLARRRPDWVVVAELVETSRLWGRVVARIDPEWAERAAGTLARREHAEPRWDAERGEAVADERVTLFGVPLVAGRRVSLARLDPELARELFLRHVLVAGEGSTDHAFLRRNRQLRHEAEEVERRARRRGLVADDEAVLAFYDERVPRDVVSVRHFDRWWKRAGRETPDLLTLPHALLVPDDVAGDEHPDRWPGDDLGLRLRYSFQPGEDADGVTVRIPVAVLNRVRPEPFEWQVPGMREDLVTELIRLLPKAIRRSFVPAPTFALAAMERMTPYRGSLLDALAAALTGMGGPVVTAADFDVDRVPAHLRMTFRVDDERGRRLAESTDLVALQRRFAARVRATVREAVGATASGWHRDGLTTWDFDVIAEVVTERRGGHEVHGYPALVDAGSTVSLRVMGTPAEARRSTAAGVRRLLLLAWPAPEKAVVGGLGNRTRLALGWSPYADVPALLADGVRAAADAIVAQHGGVPRDRAGFEALCDAGAPLLRPAVDRVMRDVAVILAAAHDVRERAGALSPSLTDVRDDVLAVLDDLVFDGFVSRTGPARLPDVARYLRALQRRLDALPDRVARDRALMATVQALEADVARWQDALPASRQDADDVAAVWWSVQEWRVSLFAQALGTAGPVSEKRIRAAMAAAGAVAG